MASPFKFFRKHQAGMMVVLVILAMLVFTLDALFTQQGANFWLLGGLLGGAVFGIAGIGSGRWLQWGLGGAALGVVMGLVMPFFTKPPGVVATKFGIIEQEDLQDMIERRNVANGFMMMAKESAFGAFARQLPPQFSFQHSTQREDVLFGRLMSEEANALGISVSDDMINTFINQQTADKLTGEAFGKARQALTYKGSPVRSETLFDILREQIRNQLAFTSLVPFGSVSSASPEVYWEYFKRLNVRQVINVAELDVDAFLDQIAEPTDEQVSDLFAAAATKRPNQDGPGSPGFFLPGRARIAWLEVDYDSVESSVAPVTDEDVEAFYNENRDVKYRTVVVPEKPASDDGAAPEGADLAPVGTTPEEDTQTPTEDSESADDSSDEPADDDAKEGETEAETNDGASAPADTDTDADDSPAKEDSQPEPTDSEEPAEESAADADTESTSPEPATESTPDGAQFSIDDPEGAADDTADDSAADDAPPSDTEPTESAPADAAAAESNAPPALVIPKMTEQEAAEAEDGPQVNLEYEYRELDDELRAEIREELQEDRVREAMEAKIEEALGYMQTLRKEMSSRRSELMKLDPQKFLDDPDAAALELRRQMTEETPELLQKMQTWAEEHGCIYAVTPLVSYLEFRNEDDYPLGVALDPNVPRFEAQGGASIAAYNIFSRFNNSDVAANDTQLLMPERAVYEPIADEGTESQYVYWTVEFIEPHIPTLDEPGVRDQVVQAYKRAEARKLVTGPEGGPEGRADVLAQKIRDGLAKEGDERMSMAATLESESITGQEGSATLTVRTSQPFSWLRQSQAAAQSFQQRPQAEMSRIRFSDGFSTLDGIDEEFMKTIFNDMNDEDVRVVPNFDRSGYFIVHVTNRFPTSDSGMDGLQERFAREGQMDFMASPVPMLMVREVVDPVIVEWEKKMWMKYDVDPDAEPEQP